MDIISLLILTTFIFHIFLSLFVHFRSSRSTANILFEVTIYAIAFWVLSVFFYRIADDATSVIWARTLYFAASFTAPAFVLFGMYFPREKPKPYWLGLVALSTMICATLSLIPGAIINSVELIPNQEKIIRFGWAYPYYVAHVAGLFSVFYVILFLKFLKFRHSDPTVKLQIQYVLLSTGIVSSLAMVTNLFLPTIGIFTYNWLGQVLTTLWVGGIAYAIIRHRLMDIRLVVARTVAYTLLVTLIGVFYVGTTYVISYLFLGFETSTRQMVVYAILTLLVALSFQRLRQTVEAMTDKILFKGHYDTNQVLARLGTIMASTIELRPLVSLLLQELITQVRISRGAVILFENSRIYTTINSGYDSPAAYTYELLQPLFKNDLTLHDDLEESQLKNLMHQLSISVASILKVKGENVGLLILGEKASGEIYSSQDIKLFEILSPEIAVAIQNAQSFDKIKQFNATLTQEVQKATADLTKANARLQDLDHLKDDFVSVASHELRTPMTAVRSYAWMALNRSDVPISPKLHRYLERILVSTERLINLVNDMLNVSRIESGRLTVAPQVFDITELVKDVLTEVEAKATEKALHLKLVSTSAPKVFADPDKVHQVLLNLVGNALKFTPHNGTITISFLADGQFVEVAVTDTGVGISPEDQSRLFQKFGRLDNSYVAAATSGGTGLGLFICKSLIELMKGKIWASSPGPGRGTTFAFTLPTASQGTIAHPEQYAHQVIGEAKVLEPVSI